MQTAAGKLERYGALKDLAVRGECSFVFRLKLGFHCLGTRKFFRRDYLDYFKLLGKIRQNLEIARILIHFTFFSLGQSVEKLIRLRALGLF